MAKPQATVTTSHKWARNAGPKLWTYNAWDVWVTAGLVGPLKQEMKETHHRDYWERTYWPAVAPMLAMQSRGLLVDQDALSRYAIKCKAELLECDDRIRVAADNPKMNINSGPQKAALLFGKLGLKSVKLTESGSRDSTDQDTLIRVLKGLRVKDQHAVPILMDLFHRSKLNTLVTRYIPIQLHRDGRVYPTVKRYGTETGRIAYARPALQQWPQSARHIFIPTPGHTFVSRDYSQIEARILALLAQDIPSLEVFASGGDVHKQNAMDLFGLTPGDWASLTRIQQKAYRNFAKTFLYGISYGGKAETMHTKLFCPCPLCEADQPPILDLPKVQIATAAQRWFSLHKSVGPWQETLIRSVVGQGQDHSYTNPLGFKRFFFEPWPTVERSIKNIPMQSTAASLMDRVMLSLHHSHVPLVLQLHDQFMAECPLGEESSMLEVMKDTMECPVPELDGYSFPTDPEMGSTWGTLEKVEE